MPATRMGAPRRRRGLDNRTINGWLLNAPALALLVFIFLLPAAIAIWFSLRSWDGVSAPAFIGLSNFGELAQTARFWSSVRTNLALAGLTLITQMPLAFTLAVVLYRRRGKMRFLRAAVFFPQVLSVGAAGLLWLMIYHPQRGLLNTALNVVAPDTVSVAWLGTPDYALPAVILATNWYYFGLHTLIFMAGMSAIPNEYYEAFRIHSNSVWSEVRYVTLPLLREQLLVSFILVVSGSFGHVLGFVAILTGGGPAGSTELLGLYSIEIGFRAARFGLASANTVVLLFLVLAILIIPVVRMTRTRLEYE